MNEEMNDNVNDIFKHLFENSDIEYYIITNLKNPVLNSNNYYAVKIFTDKLEYTYKSATKKDNYLLNLNTGDLSVNKHLVNTDFKKLFMQKIQLMMTDFKQGRVLVLEKLKDNDQEKEVAAEKQDTIGRGMEEFQRNTVMSSVKQLTKEELYQLVGGVANIALLLSTPANVARSSVVSNKKDSQESKKQIIKIKAVLVDDLILTPREVKKIVESNNQENRVSDKVFKDLVRLVDKYGSKLDQTESLSNKNLVDGQVIRRKKDHLGRFGVKTDFATIKTEKSYVNSHAKKLATVAKGAKDNFINGKESLQKFLTEIKEIEKKSPSIAREILDTSIKNNPELKDTILNGKASIDLEKKSKVSNKDLLKNIQDFVSNNNKTDKDIKDFFNKGPLSFLKNTKDGADLSRMFINHGKEDLFNSLLEIAIEHELNNCDVNDPTTIFRENTVMSKLFSGHFSNISEDWINQSLSSIAPDIIKAKDCELDMRQLEKQFPDNMAEAREQYNENIKNVTDISKKVITSLTKSAISPKMKKLTKMLHDIIDKSQFSQREDLASIKRQQTVSLFILRSLTPKITTMFTSENMTKQHPELKSTSSKTSAKFASKTTLSLCNKISGGINTSKLEYLEPILNKLETNDGVASGLKNWLDDLPDMNASNTAVVENEQHVLSDKEKIAKEALESHKKMVLATPQHKAAAETLLKDCSIEYDLIGETFDMLRQGLSIDHGVFKKALKTKMLNSIKNGKVNVGFKIKQNAKALLTEITAGQIKADDPSTIERTNTILKNAHDALALLITGRRINNITNVKQLHPLLKDKFDTTHTFSGKYVDVSLNYIKYYLAANETDRSANSAEYANYMDMKEFTEKKHKEMAEKANAARLESIQEAKKAEEAHKKMVKMDNSNAVANNKSSIIEMNPSEFRERMSKMTPGKEANMAVAKYLLVRSNEINLPGWMIRRCSKLCQELGLPDTSHKDIAKNEKQYKLVMEYMKMTKGEIDKLLVKNVSNKADIPSLEVKHMNENLNNPKLYEKIENFMVRSWMSESLNYALGTKYLVEHESIENL